MKHPAPLMRLLVRNTRTIRNLRQELSEQRQRNVSLEVRLGMALRERDQYRRDIDVVALMAKDRAVALGFVRDQHAITQLPEVGEA